MWAALQALEDKIALAEARKAAIRAVYSGNGRSPAGFNEFKSQVLATSTV